MVGARRAAFVLPVLAMAGCAVFDRFPELADDAPGPLASDAATTDSASADTAEPEDAGCPSCDADAGSLTGKYAFSATVLSDEQSVGTGPMIALGANGDAVVAFSGIGNWSTGGMAYPAPPDAGKMDYGLLRVGANGSAVSFVRADLGDMEHAGAVAIDANGAVWIAGHRYVSITETSIVHPLVAKVGADGKPVLDAAIDAVTPSSWLMSRAIRVGAGGHLVALLNFIGTIEYTEPDGTVKSITSAAPSNLPYSPEDMLVVRIDPSTGRIVWAKRIGGSEYDFGWDLAVDPAGDVYVAGQFASSSLAFPPVSRIGSRPNALLVKLAANDGSERWSRVWGDSVDPPVIGPNESLAGAEKSPMMAMAVAVDANGHVAVGGSYRGTVDFSGDPRSADQPGIFVLELDAMTGNRIWSRYGRGTYGNGGVVNALAYDATGHVTMMSTPKMATGSQNGTFAGRSFVGSGLFMALVAKMKVASGEVEWLRTVVASNGTATGSGLVAAPNGRTVGTVVVRGTADVGSGTPISSPAFVAAVSWDP